ncbi:MAG: MoaD/ThiS family protein [Ignavibacteriales bacterium]|nr:MoaD/ThiS family protein [Ignavibacteriales bacterium]
MAVKVLIPTPLRPYTNKERSVFLSGTTAGELLNELTTQFPVLKQHLYSGDGTLRSYVNVYVNDDDIRYLQQEQTPVTEKDTVSIIPSIAGGNRQCRLKVEGLTLEIQKTTSKKRIEWLINESPIN